jgi:hypothetical protein
MRNTNTTGGPNRPTSPSGGGPTGRLNKTPVDAYGLTVQKDPTVGHRLRVCLVALVIAALSFLAAWNEAQVRGVGTGLPIGFGRLADLAEQWGWSAGWVFSTLELAHLGVLFSLLALTAWFGATQAPLPLPREKIVFHRRQSAWIAANLAVPAMAGLVLAQALAAAVPLLSGLIEVVCLSLLCTALWQALVPESRISLSVVLDRNAGFGNRVVLAGGVFRRRARSTINHWRLEAADASDFGGLEFLFGARTITLRHRDDDGLRVCTQIRGVAPDPEAGLLASILNTRFRIGLSPDGLTRSQGFGRIPAEAEFVIDD